MNKKDIWIGMAVWVFLLFCPMMLMGQPHCTREQTKETQYTRTHNVLYAYVQTAIGKKSVISCSVIRETTMWN